MNRTAVALAADSATTVRYWDRGREQVRFFEGANKIFNISHRFPVGMMIYNASALLGVPWEVVAKAYRDAHGNDEHDTLETYVQDFYSFIVGEKSLFPESHQHMHLVAAISDAAQRIIRVVTKEGGQNFAEASVRAFVNSEFDDFAAHVNGDPYIDGLTNEIVDSQTAPLRGEVEKALERYDEYRNVIQAVQKEKLLELAARAVFKINWTTLDVSGLVFAGFGERQYFPQLFHFTCYGVFFGKVLCSAAPNSPVSISHVNVSAIEAFAQSEMVNTFIYGASDGAIQKIDKSHGTSIEEFANELLKTGAIAKGTDLTAAKRRAVDTFNKDVSDYLGATHARPLRNVIGMLPVDELAELAETLISIESLKEKVTRPTESVGGPIDVAVISKSDGFIWIKRKHYFEPSLNPRYIARRSS